MTLDLATVLEAVKGWPVEDRLELVGQVWDGLGEASHPPLTPAQTADLERRLELYKDNPMAGDPWEVVEARLLGKR